MSIPVFRNLESKIRKDIIFLVSCKHKAHKTSVSSKKRFNYSAEREGFTNEQRSRHKEP